jgi:hypothetical protein
MGNAYDEFEFEAEAEKPESDGGTLRKKLEAAIKTLKAKDAEIQELQKFRTEAEVGKLLKDIPAKFHKLAQKELAGNPTAEGYKAFVEEYGDLWGAEVEEVSDEEAVLRAALDKISNATREARNIKDEPFKMPPQHVLKNMPNSEIAKLAEQARANWKA